MADDHTKAQALRLAKAHLQKRGLSYGPTEIGKTARKILDGLGDFDSEDYQQRLDAILEKAAMVAMEHPVPIGCTKSAIDIANAIRALKGKSHA